MIPLTVLSDMNDVFTSLLFGTGNIFGLLILLSLILGITFLWKYGGIVMLPITLFLGMSYLDQGLGWNGLVMFFILIFILAYLIYEGRK